STPGAPSFFLTTWYASQIRTFGISKGFPLGFGVPTRSLPDSWLPERIHPDEPTPSLHPHYRGFDTTTSRSASRPRQRYSTPHGFCRLTHSLSPGTQLPELIRAYLPKFHVKAAAGTRDASTPDAAWPVTGHLPDSSRDHAYTPVQTSFYGFRRFRQHSPSPTPPDAVKPRLFLNA